MYIELPVPGNFAREILLKTNGIEIHVDPVQEWKQMYHGAWHVERDWFYDRNAHGLNLKEAE